MSKANVLEKKREQAANLLALQVTCPFLLTGLVVVALVRVSPELDLVLRFSLVFVAWVLCYLLARKAFIKILSAHAVSEQAKLDLVNRLSAIAEWKDNTIGDHNYRIGRYCQIVGANMGLSEEQQDLLFYGASLHDIGKLGLPDDLVQKPTQLTTDDRRVMERHVQLGADLLAGSDDPLLKMAHKIALTHHECWDGSGYPNGLAAEEIPLEGRIAAVCDVLDALLSKRTYKAQWSPDESIAFIKSQRGRRFDPKVVDTVVVCLPTLIEARDEQPAHYPSRKVSRMFSDCERRDLSDKSTLL